MSITTIARELANTISMPVGVLGFSKISQLENLVNEGKQTNVST